MDSVCFYGNFLSSLYIVICVGFDNSIGFYGWIKIYNFYDIS